MKTSIRVIDEAIATKTSSLNNLVAEKERLLNNTLQIQEQINNTAHDIENLQYEVRLMKGNYGAVDCNVQSKPQDCREETEYERQARLQAQSARSISEAFEPKGTLKNQRV